MDAETKAYLDRIRKTIADSKNLISQAELRIAETDRMLERQGLTREQVMAMRFSEAQMEAVNAELRRRGLDPIEDFPEDNETLEIPENPVPLGASSVELENRQKKFGMMMKPFQI